MGAVVAPASIALSSCFRGTSPETVNDLPPPPPASLEELTKPLTTIPICDLRAPACIEKRERAYEDAYSSLNTILGRNIRQVVMRIDKITGSASDGYESNGPVVWDPVSESNRGAIGAGLAAGFLSLLGGSSPLEATGSAAGTAASGYDGKSLGKCLVSTDKSFKGYGSVHLFLNSPNITSLKGYETGSYVKVSFDGSFLPFQNGGMFEENSRISQDPGESNFGEIMIYSVGATVTPVKEPELHQYCKESSVK